jgi:hypothetical protein
LKAAVDLTPKNALIWYNLAVVESKEGDSAPAFEHLQKAENIGLPKALQNDADQLEARLSYDAKRKAKLDTFPVKVQEFQKQVNEGTIMNVHTQNGADSHDRDCAYELTLTDSAILSWKFNDISDRLYSYHADSLDYGHISFSFADLVPEVQIKENQNTFCGPSYLVTAKAQAPKFFKGTSTHQRFCSPSSGTSFMCENFPPVEQDSTEITIPFPTKALAEAAARTLSELILLSKIAQP